MARTMGTARAAMRVMRQSRRKRRRTRAARPTPMRTASRTPVADWVMRSLWSYQLMMETSEGMAFFMPAMAARMSVAIWTVLPPGCW